MRIENSADVWLQTVQKLCIQSRLTANVTAFLYCACWNSLRRRQWDSEAWFTVRSGQTFQPLREGTCGKHKLYFVWLCTHLVIPSAQQVLTCSRSRESDDLCRRMRRPKRTRPTRLQGKKTAEPTWMLQHESWQQYQKHMSEKSVTPLSQEMNILAHSPDLNYTPVRF